MALNSHQLRKTKVSHAKKHKDNLKRNQIVLVLDNVLDTYNIGSFFRLADAIGAQKIFLCGPCVTPPNIKIHRASIGTWKFIPWQHFDFTAECLDYLHKNKYFTVACELSKDSELYNKTKYQFPVALILGSEVNGISKDILSKVDKVVEIPMFGINKSLNVLVAASIISYHILMEPSK